MMIAIKELANNECHYYIWMEHFKHLKAQVSWEDY